MLARLVKFWPQILIVIVIFAFFSKLFFPLSLFITPDYGRSDSWSLSIANKSYLAQNLQNNLIPIWNNQIGTGYPTLAEGQTGIFFPLNLIVFKLFYFPLAYNLIFVLTLSLAAWGQYLFLTAFGVKRIESVYGGLIFALGSFFILHVQHIHLIQTASLLPWLFFAYYKFLHTRKVIYLALLSTFIFFQISAGFFQLVLYSLTALALFIFFTLWHKKQKVRIFLLVTASIIFGFLISSIQLLPTLEFLSKSTRGEHFSATLTEFPYKFKNLIQFFDPFALGSPRNGTYPKWIPGRWGIYWESVAYVGIIPFSLAIASFAGSLIKKSKNSKLTFFFFCLLIISIVLSLGVNAPLHPFLSFWPFSMFRVPSRFLLIAQFCLSTLTALYLEKVKFNRVFLSLILVVSVLNIYYYFSNYNQTDNAEKWSQKPQTASWLENNGVKRIYSLGNSEFWNKNFRSGWANDTNYYYFARNSLDQNSNLIFDIQNLFPYESLLTKRSAFFRSTLEQNVFILNNSVIIPKKTALLLASQNVSHIITPLELKSAFFTKEYESDSYKNQEFKVYKNKISPQRLFITNHSIYVKSIPEINSAFAQTQFDPTSQVILETEEKPETNVSDWEANIVSETPTKLEVKTRLDGNGYLVLADSLYPGWKVFVDSKEEKIIPANINNRAVYLKSGEHDVLFTYEPLTLKIGIIISALSAISIISLTVTAYYLKLQI